MASILSIVDSATVSTTEISLTTGAAGLQLNATKGFVQAIIDLGTMVAGDTYRIRIHGAPDGVGANQKMIWEAHVSGLQDQAFITPPILLDNNWDLGITKIAGTDRSIAWTLNQDLSGEGAVVTLASGSVVSGTFGAGAIDANALNASAATEIAAAVMAQNVDTLSLESAVKLFLAALVGKASGFDTGSHKYRNPADTKDRISATVTSTGRTAVTLDLT